MNILPSITQHTNKGAIYVGLFKRLFVCILYISKWKVKLNKRQIPTMERPLLTSDIRVGRGVPQNRTL